MCKPWRTINWVDLHLSQAEVAFNAVVHHDTMFFPSSSVIDFLYFSCKCEIENSFLNGYLHKEVYIKQLLGFVQPLFSHHVCYLKKSLHGLKHASKTYPIAQSPFFWLQRSNYQCLSIISNNISLFYLFIMMMTCFVGIILTCLLLHCYYVLTLLWRIWEICTTYLGFKQLILPLFFFFLWTLILRKSSISIFLRYYAHEFFHELLCRTDRDVLAN